MGDQNVKLWVGIGACVLAGSTATAAAETAAPGIPVTHAAPTLIASASEHGGEGGEGGEASSGGEGGEGGEASSGGDSGEASGGEGGEAASGGEGGEGGGGVGPMSVFGGGGEGGEGGEGGSYGPSATESPGVFYTHLALMLGHMEVGHALYEAGEPGAGSTHLGHPAAEHLPAIREALAQRSLDGTRERIQALAETAGGGADWEAVEPAFGAAREAIRTAMDNVAAERRRDAAFLAKVLTALLHHARHEYEEAVEGDTFVEAHEYHDSYGFVQVGRGILADNAAVFEGADADAYANLVEQYEGVMAAWPTATIPAKPAMSVSRLYGRISAFELAAGRF